MANEREIEIPAGNLEIAQQRVDKLNRRATKMGVSLLRLEATEPFMKKVCISRNDEGREVQRDLPFVKVTLIGESPKLVGWTVVAQLERIEDAGVVVNILPGETLDASWRDRDSYCDHCQTKRRRLTTYILRDQSGKLIQIGGDCLRDFQGHDISKVLDFTFESMGCLDDLEEWGSGGSRNTLWATDYLSWVVQAVRESGWLSRSKAREDGRTATADIAVNTMDDYLYGSEKDKPKPPTKEDHAKAEICLKWVREEVAPKLQKSDYEHNLSLVLSRDVVNLKHLGIAASAVAAWERAENSRIAFEKKFADEKKSVFQGEIGKRQLFPGLTLVFSKIFEGDYGSKTLLKFKDENGNIFVWWASGEREGFEDEKGERHGGQYVRGETYDLVATVKKHDEWKGIKQTVVNRGAIDGEWGCPCGCFQLMKAETHCPKGHEKGSWRCPSCWTLNGPSEKECLGKYKENGVDREGCGHTPKSWRCPRCTNYNHKKAKTCEIPDFDKKICGTAKRAWMCRDYMCRKWNQDPKGICECGRDVKGNQTRKEEVPHA